MPYDKYGFCDWSEMGGNLRTFKENVAIRFGINQEDKEEELGNVLSSIKTHLTEENHFGVNQSIGRGHIKLNGGVSNVWITNDIPNTRYKNLPEKDKNKLGVMQSKNSSWGRAILHNFEGHHVVKAPGGVYSFDILNSSSYIPVSFDDAERVRVGFHGNGWTSNLNLLQALNDVQITEKLLAQKRKELQEKIAEEEQKRQAAIDEEKRKAEALQKAKDEQERRRIAEEKQRQEEEQRRREEEAMRELQQLAEEAEDLDIKLKEERERYSHAAKFIRKQASLRLNPVLDDIQETVKFSNMYNGVVTIIDGGPGTGKTTTLIQRLRLLISADDLKDYMENSSEFTINARQLEIINQNGGDWIFFSPTELLKQYMKENMNYEGLSNTSTKVVVWNDYLRKILRDEYHLVGENAPFRFKLINHEGTILIKKDDIKVIESFQKYFVESVKHDIDWIANLDMSKFSSWKIFGQMVVKDCAAINDCSSSKDIIRLLIALNTLNTIELPNQQKNGEQLSKEYISQINKIALEQMALLKRNDEKYNSLLKWVEDELYGDDELYDSEPDTDNDEIDADNENAQDLENELLKRIKSLLRGIALSFIDNSTQLTKKQQELKSLIGDSLHTEPLAGLGELAFYNKKVHPVLNNIESFLFSRIPKCYKQFRNEIFKNADSTVWNVDLLKTIVKNENNRPLHPQEQALMLGFINNLICDIRQISIPLFTDLHHKYSLAYKNSCKPVIGIDEATDYCVMDYYAISSLRHYETSTITLTGDSMQCLRSNGIMDWSQLEHPLIFNKLAVTELKTSYRQSPELLKLGHALYKASIGKNAPYSCYEDLKDEIVPQPLWYESDDENQKAEWMVERIREVKRSYGMVPSIAIFVNNREEARELEAAIKDLGKLESRGIQIADCSGGDKMATTDTVRIFPLNSVKGMEFEVAFFYNVDKITNLVDRYLYVGLSRATFYLAVATNKQNSPQLNAIKKLFKLNGDWRHLNTTKL